MDPTSMFRDPTGQGINLSNSQFTSMLKQYYATANNLPVEEVVINQGIISSRQRAAAPSIVISPTGLATGLRTLTIASPSGLTAVDKAKRKAVATRFSKIVTDNQSLTDPRFGWILDVTNLRPDGTGAVRRKKSSPKNKDKFWLSGLPIVAARSAANQYKLALDLLVEYNVLDANTAKNYDQNFRQQAAVSPVISPTKVAQPIVSPTKVAQPIVSPTIGPSQMITISPATSLVKPPTQPTGLTAKDKVNRNNVKIRILKINEQNESITDPAQKLLLDVTNLTVGGTGSKTIKRLQAQQNGLIEISGLPIAAKPRSSGYITVLDILTDHKVIDQPTAQSYATKFRSVQ